MRCLGSSQVLAFSTRSLLVFSVHQRVLAYFRLALVTTVFRGRACVFQIYVD